MPTRHAARRPLVAMMLLGVAGAFMCLVLGMFFIRYKTPHIDQVVTALLVFVVLGTLSYIGLKCVCIPLGRRGEGYSGLGEDGGVEADVFFADDDGD